MNIKEMNMFATGTRVGLSKTNIREIRLSATGTRVGLTKTNMQEAKYVCYRYIDKD